MANYMGVLVTNDFKVADEEKFKALLERLSSECGIEHYETDRPSGHYHCLASYGDISLEMEDGEIEYDMSVLFEELQACIPEDECIVFLEAGHEKLRYVNGAVSIITKHAIYEENIISWAVKKCRELYGDDYDPHIDM